MQFSTPLIRAKLLRRYKRFLADCQLPDGREITAHCANPGAMTGLAEPGTTLWLEPNDDPKRKLNFSWKLVQLGSEFAGIDTGVANRIVGEALREGAIVECQGYADVLPEQRYEQNSRVDFLLRGPEKPDLYLEVKSVTLMRCPGFAEFPDTVTSRGAKHLEALANMMRAGHHAALCYLVQRTDADRVGVAADIDPTYFKAIEAARSAGVVVFAYDCLISPQAIALGKPLPVEDW